MIKGVGYSIIGEVITEQVTSKTKSGLLFIPSQAQAHVQYVKVNSVGAKVEEVKVGDIIIVKTTAGVNIDGTERVFLMADVMGVYSYEEVPVS
jgi:co-chaperonin GroES (HSP10)